jgi:hypothetical protein
MRLQTLSDSAPLATSGLWCRTREVHRQKPVHGQHLFMLEPGWATQPMYGPTDENLVLERWRRPRRCPVHHSLGRVARACGRDWKSSVFQHLVWEASGRISASPRIVAGTRRGYTVGHL